MESFLEGADDQQAFNHNVNQVGLGSTMGFHLAPAIWRWPPAEFQDLDRAEILPLEALSIGRASV